MNDMTDKIAACRAGTCSHARRDDPGHGELIERFFNVWDSEALPSGMLAGSGPVIYKYGRRLPRKLKKRARTGLVITRYRRGNESPRQMDPHHEQ
jgi:hypothetical protein